MTPAPNAPDTIVLIHGFWVTPRSWEDWKAYYEQQGYRVLTPAYPGFEVEVEALNADPGPIEKVTVPQIVDHLQEVVGALETPPILIGHSAGGVFTQVLLDHGYGAVGVAIAVPLTYGVVTLPDGPLDRPTDSTVCDRAVLRAELARSRRRGWATTVDELEVGLSGIAVPVFGPRGQVVGAVGVSGPTARVQVRFDEVGPLLREHAAELTELLRVKTPEEAA